MKGFREVLQAHRRFCEDLVRRRFVFGPGFEIYGGCAGLYDYGPVGCAIKNNIEQTWREHFILEDELLQINSTCITPEPVLVASGHVAKFEDLMVKDTLTGSCYRADKLITDFIEAKLAKEKAKAPKEATAALESLLVRVDGMKEAQISKTISDLGIRAPQTNNPLSEPQPFNLMFKTNIGPSNNSTGYLRPETAQGIFVNFAKLLQFSGGRIPMGTAQIGLGFRNEIAPRNGLLRVREFQMAEIEYFVDPLNKSHPKFGQVKDLLLPLWSGKSQAENGPVAEVRLGEAVEKGVVNNETIGYFIARIYLFLLECGIQPEGIRFRQHQPTEMAHYATDCWDAEICTSNGWVECVGCADRSAFDLEHHSTHSGSRLVAARKFKEPVQVQVVALKINKGSLGKRFKKDGMKMIQRLEKSSEEERRAFRAEMEGSKKLVLAVEGQQFELSPEEVQFQLKTQNVMEEKFVPHVIEPSFGLGRILFAVLEHSFRMRDEKRTYFHLRPRIAPLKCSILPLLNNPELNRFTYEVRELLKKALISCKVDDSGQSIGRRYARTDEIGIPFAITVDFDSLKDGTVALRELSQCGQIRVPRESLSPVLRRLLEGQPWAAIEAEFPKFSVDEKDEKQ